MVLFGGCEGRPSCLSPRTSCLGAPSAPPDRGSPWEPSRDCLPDEIAEERVADGVRVGGSVAVAEFTGLF